MQWGNLDPRVTEQETNCIFENLNGAKKLVVYDAAGHQDLRKFNREKWEGEVKAFLTE